MTGGYAETAAKAHAGEYAWIKTEGEQQLSDELDRVVKINPHWRNTYLSRGRETACLELMYEKAIIECSIIIQKRQEAIDEAEAPRRDFEFKNWCYLHRERHWPVTTDAAFAHVQKTDAAFIAKQKTVGFPTDKLESYIAERQKQDSEYIAWAKLKIRREERAETELLRKQASMNAEAIMAKAEELILELVAAGVLRVSK